MCTGGYCFRRGTEFHLIIILGCLGIGLVDKILIATDGYNSIPNPQTYTPAEQKINLIREIVWWIYMTLLLAINLSVRIFHKNYRVIVWATLPYGFLALSGLIIWPILREWGYDHQGLAPLVFMVVWLVCAIFGIMQFISLINWSRRLKVHPPPRPIIVEILLADSQNTNGTVTKI